MLKKILIGVGVLALIIVAGLFYLNNRNRTMSPPGNAELTSGDLSVSISYSRPSVRGRLIFGTQEEGALQPNGAYWRLGANESTEVTINKDVNFSDKQIKAGTYKMYAVPGSDSFDIALNSELGKWGAMEPDYSLDVIHTAVPVEKSSASVEQFTISLAAAEKGINIVFEWSDRKWVVPVTVQ